MKAASNYETSKALQAVVYLFVLPPVCLAGSLATGLSVYVFTRRSMRSSLNVYLAALSAFDCLLLASSLALYPSLSVCELTKSVFFCRAFFPYAALAFFPVSRMAQCGSTLVCLAVTVDRFVAVRYPLKKRIWCTPRRALYTVVVLVVSSAFYRASSFFELTLSANGTLTRTELRQDQFYYVFVHIYLDGTVLFLIPWSLMVVLNGVVIVSVHKAYSQRRFMASSRISAISFSADGESAPSVNRRRRANNDQDK